MCVRVHACACVYVWVGVHAGMYNVGLTVLMLLQLLVT